MRSASDPHDYAAEHEAGTGPRGRESLHGDDATHVLRVPAAKVTKVLDLVGELSLAVAEAIRALGADRDGSAAAAEKIAHRLENVVRDVHEAASELRLVRVGEAFRRMARLTRELERGTGKKITLETHGDDTRIDKSVLDRLNEPLVHLFRNAVDHGLESPDERRAAGKSDVGHLTLSAGVVGRELIVKVSDDGRGLNREKILARARQRGLVAATAEPTDDELWPVIFEAGFSTADTVTNLSGRGVGMDVVRSTVRDLRGSLSIDTTPGHGTTITLALAVSVAFLDCLVMRIGARLVAIPIETVGEILLVSLDALTTVRDRAHARMLRTRGELIAVRELAAFYDEPRTDLPPLDAHAQARTMVVVRSGSARMALPVDELFGQQQAIVKPLEGELARVRGALGCAILANGEVATVLDVAALVRGAHG